MLFDTEKAIQKHAEIVWRKPQTPFVYLYLWQIAMLYYVKVSLELRLDKFIRWSKEKKIMKQILHYKNFHSKLTNMS